MVAQYLSSDFYLNMASASLSGTWRRWGMSHEQRQLDKLVERAMQRSAYANIERAYARTDAYVWLLRIDADKSVTLELSRIESAVRDAVGRKNFQQKVTVYADPLRVEIRHVNPVPVRLLDTLAQLGKLKRNEYAFCPGVRQRVSDHVLHPMSLTDSAVAQIMVAGSTGSGKTILAVNILTTLALLNDPDKLSLLVIDPKRVDIGNTDIQRLPHLAHPVITDPGLGVTAIYRLAAEMHNRQLAIDECTRSRKRWTMPGRIFCYVDELYELIENDAQVTKALTWIAAQGRGLGIHLCLATQRPTVDMVDGALRANLPTRFGGWVRSADESRIVTGLPGSGLEELQGAGMFKLFVRDNPISLQSFAVDLDSELPKIVDKVGEGKSYWKIENLSTTEDMPEVVAETVAEVVGASEATYAWVLGEVQAGREPSLNAISRKRVELGGSQVGRLEAKAIIERAKGGSK